MKLHMLIVLLLAGNGILAQNKFALNLSISNQGQFDKVLEDFYVPAHPTALLDDSHKGNDLRIKYNLNAAYLMKDSFELRLRLGWAIRNNHYEQSFPTSSWVVDDNQRVFEICPSYGFSKRFGRFAFSTGLEIPLYIVGSLSEKVDYREFSDSVNLSHAANSDIQMDGGFITGLNQYLNIQTFLSKNIYLFSELNYGLLYSKLGGKYQDNGGITFPTVIDQHIEFDKSYSKIYFSPIQVQFGVGYRF